MDEREEYRSPPQGRTVPAAVPRQSHVRVSVGFRTEMARAKREAGNKGREREGSGNAGLDSQPCSLTDAFVAGSECGCRTKNHAL